MIPLSVFVVHPDAAIASRIARAVATAGHAPVLLADGERAIDRFVLEPADVVVLDYFLPGRDGVSTVESIRWAPGGRDVHVVLLAERDPEIASLADLGKRVSAIATFVGAQRTGTGVEDAIESILGSLGLPPGGESTRVASLHELSGALARVALPTSALDGRIGERSSAGSREAAPKDGAAGGADEPAWPVIETVMLHASTHAMRDGQGGGSGVKRRPEPSPEERRLTTPPPPLPAKETTRELDLARARAANRAEPDHAAMQEGQDVRESAKAVAEGSQRIMGRFDDTPFAALLKRLADGRTTGALVCIGESQARETTTGDPPTKIVHFRAGLPVHVRSNLVDECLGQILVRRRRIGAATLEESIRRMRLGHGLQGEILIDMGALAPIELSEALADQSRDKLFDLFAWQRGTYRFSTKLDLPHGVVGVELPLAEIVYEGVCAAMSPQRLLGILSPSLERFVLPDAVQLARFVRVRLVPEVRHVLARIDGSLRLREVLSMGSRPGAVAQLVYAMECLGAVRFAEEPRRAPSVSREVAEPPVPEELTDVPRPGVLSTEPPTMPPADGSPLEGPPRSGEGPTDGSEGPPEVEPVPDPYDDDDVERESAPAGEAWDDATAPQRERVVPPPRITITGDAPLDSSGLNAPLDRSGLHATPERDEHSSPATGSTQEEIPAAGALDARVDRLFEAERHFRRGNRALDRGKLDEALGAFARATELCPEQGEFLAYVGWTRHCLAPDDLAATDMALAELARSRQLAPEIHVTHLLHARVLSTAGHTADAHAAYVRALELDPTCAEAAAAVTAPL